MLVGTLGHFFNDTAKNYISGVIVAVEVSRVMRKVTTTEPLNEVIFFKQKTSSCIPIIEGICEIRNPGLMCQQMVQSYLLSLVFPVIKEMFCDRVIEGELFLLDQLHDNHAAKLLADRSQTKFRID